jgi:glycosyltransferase involved in cell wall biosynthesis
VRLVNAFADAEHAIVSGDPARRSAAALIGKRARVSWPAIPPLAGKPLPGRLKKLAAAMAGYDLTCTYNWGAIDAAMAHTLFADFYKLAPLVHHEDGFDEDEAQGFKPRRNLYRRFALGRTSALVVPSRALERIALETWDQPRSRVQLIPNGIDSKAYARRAKPDALPRVIKQKGELWVGTLAGLRKVKNLPALVRACRELPDEWQLVIAGEGPERETISAEAASCGIEDRVHLPGFVIDPAKALGLFDVFALSSHSEQFPISVVEAMAAGLPIVAPRVGDVAAMVASDNGPYIVPPGDEQALANAISALAFDPAARARVGEANRKKAAEEFDETRMSERYRALYWGLMGRK